MIWNSGHDENGAYAWGVPGDQTGGECCIRPWFSSPWDCVLRYPDQSLAAEAAELGRHAAGNDLIGYCQAHRNTFYEQLAATGTWDPADIAEPCEGDCCRDCTTVWQAVGERHGIEALKRLDPDPYGDTTYTANARERYEAAGFQVLTGSFFTGSDAHLLPGDCLLNEGMHMAMQLDVGWDVDEGVWCPGDSGQAPEEEDDIKEATMNFASIIEAPEGRYLWDGHGLHEIKTDGELESVKGVYEKDGSTMPKYTFCKEGSVGRIRAVLAR